MCRGGSLCDECNVYHTNVGGAVQVSSTPAQAAVAHVQSVEGTKLADLMACSSMQLSAAGKLQQQDTAVHQDTYGAQIAQTARWVSASMHSQGLKFGPKSQTLHMLEYHNGSLRLMAFEVLPRAELHVIRFGYTVHLL